jgi:hypothetical protein
VSVEAASSPRAVEASCSGDALRTSVTWSGAKPERGRDWSDRDAADGSPIVRRQTIGHARSWSSAEGSGRGVRLSPISTKPPRARVPRPRQPSRRFRRADGGTRPVSRPSLPSVRSRGYPWRCPIRRSPGEEHARMRSASARPMIRCPPLTGWTGRQCSRRCPSRSGLRPRGHRHARLPRRRASPRTTR